MEEKSLELKKHVGIIHCANNLTLLQRKLANALLFHAYGNLLSQEKHKIKIGEILKLIGYDSHDYDTLKKAFKALMSVVLEWNLLKKDVYVNENQYVDDKDNLYKMDLKEGQGGKSYSWHASSILASASINGSMCTYSYSPELKELLYMPEVYGKINLLVQSRFTSAYSLALYENCIRFKNLSHTGWISSDIFRKLMGVSDGKYKKYKDFKKRVLDKAIEEINKLSDIYVTQELKRDCSQQTFFIRFFLKSNEAFQKTIFKYNDNKIGNEKFSDKEINQKIPQILKEQFCLSEKQIKRLINSYSADYILSKINLVQKSSSYKNKRIVNISAYFLSAVKEDFQQPVGVVVIKDNENKKVKEVEKKKKLEQEQEYKNYKAEAIDSFLEKIDIKKKKIMDDAFQKEIKSNPLKFLAKKFKESGMENSLIQAFYRDFILKNYSDLIKIVSFDDFVRG